MVQLNRSAEVAGFPNTLYNWWNYRIFFLIFVCVQIFDRQPHLGCGDGSWSRKFNDVRLASLDSEETWMNESQQINMRARDNVNWADAVYSTHFMTLAAFASRHARIFIDTASDLLLVFRAVLMYIIYWGQSSNSVYILHSMIIMR